MPEFYKKQWFLYPVYVLAFFVFVLISILCYFHLLMGIVSFFIFLYRPPLFVVGTNLNLLSKRILKT